MDGENLFFVSKLSVGERFIEGNVCVDTGLEMTIGTSKYFKKNRDHLLNLDVKVLSANSVSGVTNNLVRIAPLVLVRIQGANEMETIEISDVPVMLRNISSPSCDLILGKNILQKMLIEIDFQKRMVTLGY